MSKLTPAEKSRKWRADHTEENRTYQREWARKQYASDPERMKARHRAWSKAKYASDSDWRDHVKWNVKVYQQTTAIGQLTYERRVLRKAGRIA